MSFSCNVTYVTIRKINLFISCDNVTLLMTGGGLRYRNYLFLRLFKLKQKSYKLKALF